MGEDPFADGGAQVTALVRVTGLEDHRMALVGPGNVERADDREMLAPVVKSMLAGGVQENALLTVVGEGIVLVGVPQALCDLDELEPAPVAGVVVVVLPAALVTPPPPHRRW